MTDNLPSTSNGFSNRSGRLIKGLRLSWNQEWSDQDGCPPPGEMLVPGFKEILQRWQGGLPSVIDASPLPDPDLLNDAIPIKEWEDDMNGQPSPPWKRTYVVYFIDPIAASTYTFVSPTTGARIAYEQLAEQVETKRMLVGGDVIPLVHLGERPMKTRYGLKSRPALEILSWRTPGNGAGQMPASPPLQLLTEGATPEAPAVEPEPEPAKHVPVAETTPPAGRKPGKIEVTSGKQGKPKIRLETEARRPDLKQNLNDGLDDLPFDR
ncbi:MAG TPA: hypothetical protein VGG77_15070 [Roseiarcus sp.]|jgi:hypothetical protein